jgi:hypothetical protein
VLGRAREGGREGKEKGGHNGRGAPFVSDATGGGGQAAGGATGRQCVGWGRGASEAVGQHGLVGSSLATALVGGTRAAGG